MKCSHLFNTLDARGAVSVTERVAVIKRVRDLAVGEQLELLELLVVGLGALCALRHGAREPTRAPALSPG